MAKGKRKAADQADQPDQPDQPDQHDSTPAAKKARVRKAMALDDEARKKMIHDAVHSNPTHVRIMGKSLDSSNALMAGYLHFVDTNALRAWLHGTGDDQRAHDTLERWKKNRERNFGSVVMDDKTKGSGVAINAKKLWQFLESEVSRYVILKLSRDISPSVPFSPAHRPPRRLDPLVGAGSAGLPLATDSGYTTGSDLYITASWVTTMARLVHDHPQQFPDTHDSTKPKLAHIAAEDWFRAFQALRMYWRSTTGARAASATGSKLQNQLAAVPEFYTDHDAAGASTLGEADVPADQAHPSEVLIDIANDIRGEQEDDLIYQTDRNQVLVDEVTLDALDQHIATRPPPGKSPSCRATTLTVLMLTFAPTRPTREEI